MTKTAVIEYNEADETLLQLFFEKLRVTFKKSLDVLKPEPLKDNEPEPLDDDEHELLFDEKDDPQSLTDFFEKHNLSKKNRQFFRELHYSLEECYAMQRGEIKSEQTYEDYLIELKQIANANRTLETV